MRSSIVRNMILNLRIFEQTKKTINQAAVTTVTTQMRAYRQPDLKWGFVMINEEQIRLLTEKWTEEAKEDLLYIAIRLNDAAEIERLKSEGAVLSEHIKHMLTEGGGNLTTLTITEYIIDRYDLDSKLLFYSPEEFVAVIRNLRAEIDEPIFCPYNVTSYIPNFYSAEIFRCVLDCFDTKKIKKKQTLIYIIDNDMVGLLDIAAAHGWFKTAKKCDEYIAYARGENHIECAAFLIDYKNKSFDLALEREKEAKRRHAALVASPDSVTMLKTLWTYQKRENDGTIVIKRYKGSSTQITVPEKIGKSTVTALENEDFNNGVSGKCFFPPELWNTITKITLPSGLVSIGNGVFSELTELSEINIPQCVLSIGECAFFNCKKLKALTLPDSVKSIGKMAFSGCEGLEQICIPSGITEISVCVFSRCKSLKSVKIPESVRSICKGAFLNCESIDTVTIPRGVTEISDSTFGRCGNLTHVELPDTVKKIGKYAFGMCTALKEIVIPEGVREIGEMAFGKCAALERVVLPASLKKAENYTTDGITPKICSIFDDSPNVTAVVTPESYAEKYCRENDIPFVYN